VCFDPEGQIIPGKSTLVVSNQNITYLKFALGLLNSKLPIFYIKEKYRGSSYNQGINFNKDMINNLPLPELDNKIITLMLRFVDQLLSIKNADHTTDSTKLEKQIDELVYKLYDLTAEEIKIIE